MSVQTASTTDRASAGTGRAEELGRMAFSAIASGDWPRAWDNSRDSLLLADPVREPVVLAQAQAAAGIVAAVRGDSTASRALLDSAERAGVAFGISTLLDAVQLGRGIEALSAGRYDEALARLRQLLTVGVETSVWIRLVAVGFLAETELNGGGELAAVIVRSAVDRLAAAPDLRGATAYARAMSRPEVALGPRFDAALAECPVGRTFDRARINLAKGVLLRRGRRVLESRPPLQEALVGFERLGAAAWVERARRELRATGARRTSRHPGAVETLTPQELQIVRMAAAGMTNREIGQSLFLSHRTVGSHLYRVFPKLGVAARSQLRDVLDDLTDLDAAPGGVAH